MAEISIAFQTDKPLTAYGPLAAQVESYGFDAVTVYNDLLYQPAWLPLWEMARATHSVRVGVAAVNPFTCHPVNIAGHTALINDAAGGRMYLGLARGGWLDFLGLYPQRTVTALREAFECVQHLLQQSDEPYNGAIFQTAGGDALRWPIAHPQVSMLLGSWGAQTIQACAPYIEEIKIGGSANPAVIPHMRKLVDVAAVKAGRQPHDIGIVVGAVCVVDDDGPAARDYVRREVALYLPVVAELDPTVALDPALLAQLKQAAARFDYDAAASLISDDLLTRFAFAGTPDEVAAQAQALLAAGATRVEFGTPHGRTTAEGLRLLGEEVLPQLK